MRYRLIFSNHHSFAIAEESQHGLHIVSGKRL